MTLLHLENIFSSINLYILYSIYSYFFHIIYIFISSCFSYPSNPHSFFLLRFVCRVEYVLMFSTQFFFLHNLVCPFKQHKKKYIYEKEPSTPPQRHKPSKISFLLNSVWKYLNDVIRKTFNPWKDCVYILIEWLYIRKMFIFFYLCEGIKEILFVF